MQEKGESLLICPRSIKDLLLPRLWFSGRSQPREKVDLQLSTTRATRKAEGKAIGDAADAAGLAEMGDPGPFPLGSLKTWICSCVLYRKSTTFHFLIVFPSFSTSFFLFSFMYSLFVF
jgi:hypothetical protein